MKLRSGLWSLAIWMLTSAIGPITSAQTPASDPNQYMQSAAEANSLTAADMKAWHLRARYQQKDPEGTTKSPGGIEIWWAGPENYKVSYTRKEFTQTEYRVGDKILLTGQDDWRPILERRVLGLLVDPMHGVQSRIKLAFTEKDKSFGDQKFGCYTLPGATNPHQVSTVQTYCFNVSDQALRLMIDNHGFKTNFDKVVSLQSRSVATHIHKEISKSRTMDILVEQIESPLATEMPDLTPPADARPSPAPAVSLGGSWGAPLLPPKVLHSVEPDFPQDYGNRQVDEVVTITLIVSTAGNPVDLNAISGPPELQRAALQAVRTYRFNPAMCLGQPVEVEISVDVRFQRY